MLGATMVKMPSADKHSEDATIVRKRGRHTINLTTEVFTRLGEYVARWGNSKENVANNAVYDTVYLKDQFLKVYAPHLTLENSTVNSIFINDHELGRTAVIKVRWNNITKEEKRPLMSVYCELCDSDNCIHVRYSLVLPNILRLEKSGKLV